MISGSIARRYAKALLQLGVDGKNYEALGGELSRVVKLLHEQKALHDALVSPIIPPSSRKNIVRDVLAKLGISKTMEHFLLLLIDHNRMNVVVAIEREYGALVDLQAGRVRAVLSSPKPVPPALEARVKSALEKRTGKQVILEKREDPSLLAGVVVQIGDVIYDGSARAALGRIREELLRD